MLWLWPCVRLSVRPSQAGFYQNGVIITIYFRQQLAHKKQPHTITHKRAQKEQLHTKQNSNYKKQENVAKQI